jgi:hypothetical protein
MTQDTQETAQFEGLTCRKVLIKTMEGEEGYSWVSDELKEVVLEKLGARVMWRLVDMKRGEPDPKLFEIPPDYKEVSSGWKPPTMPPPR